MTDELSGSKSIEQKFEMQAAVIRIKVPVTIIIKHPLAFRNLAKLL